MLKELRQVACIAQCDKTDGVLLEDMYMWPFDRLVQGKSGDCHIYRKHLENKDSE